MEFYLFYSRLFVLLGFVILNTQLSAEPWLSTRYAQNCAGCHSPGRKNLPPPDRRCSLSCQGCHVNPNGGGMRSFYGKWNSQYWLRSARIKKNNYNKKIFADFSKQIYGKEYLAGKKPSKRKMKRIAKVGYPLVEAKKRESTRKNTTGMQISFIC